MRRMAICTALTVVVALSASLGGFSRDARSSDHGDAAAPASDIADLYAFVDQDRFVMMMTVFPFATPEATFSRTSLYVFHTSSGSEFGHTTMDLDVICRFASASSATCWLGTEDFVSGDPSDASAPLISESGNLAVFAGMRRDPFFFNLSGFRDTVALVRSAAPGLTFDASGCPSVDAATSQALLTTLAEVPSRAEPGRTNPDDLATASVLALVVSVARSLVTRGGDSVSVWASTNEVG